MFKAKEIPPIIATILILAVIISLLKTWNLFFTVIIFLFIIIFANILFKKATSHYLDSEIEIKLWEIKRYGFQPHSYFKNSFPAGAFFPIIISGLTLGAISWMGSLVFDVKAKVYRAAKRHGLYS
ncbi:hypothetical protein ISS08_02315, partial [Candidatus Pacearchaeota archaeon]|nr:hypothetical protein [Candidatus Pacearchaeota archaeon]